MKKIAKDLFTQSTSFTQEVDLDASRNISLQFRTSNGTTALGNEFTGTCKLQITNDFDVWFDVAGTSQTISGVSFSHIFDNISTNASHIRIEVTITKGSADFEIDWVIKD